MYVYMYVYIYIYIYDVIYLHTYASLTTQGDVFYYGANHKRTCHPNEEEPLGASDSCDHIMVNQH